jgi:osmoprotectant transport system substrate-binding protein
MRRRERVPPLATRCATLLAVAALAGGCGGSQEPLPPQSTTVTTSTTAAASTPQTTSTGTVTQVLPGTGRPQVALGDKNTPEQFILGELYLQALTAEGYTVTLTRNIGPTDVSVRALQQGSLDLYPEYLNVWNSEVTGHQRGFRSPAAAYGAAADWAAHHQMVLLDPTPFGDVDGIAVTTAFAQAHHLRTLTDLRRVARTMTVGGPLPFLQGPGGLSQVERAYGIHPAATRPVDIGSQYAALRNGVIQAAYVNTSDGQLSTPEFRLLADPEHVFGFGNVVPVVPERVIAEEGPSFAATINSVDALLTTRVMRWLNAEAALEHEDPTTIARTLLQEYGLIPLPSSSG